MVRTTSFRAAAGLFLVLSATLLAGGCSARSTPAPQPQSSTSGASAGIARMTSEKKRSSIATDFPIEVPLPDGRVVRGESQGSGLWDYQLEVPFSASDVVNWYATLYPKAEWQPIGDEAVGDGRRLTFVKGGYAADMTITPIGPKLTKVTAVVGIGQTVLNTQ